jgi:predicted esterase
VSGVPGAPPAALYVPDSLDEGPAWLVVSLHGAGSSAERGLALLASHAERHRLLVVAPKSVGRTWDVIRGGYGPDVLNIDRLLRRVTRRYPVSGLSVAGFSDGASYALSIGLSNGAVFDSVVAFSPGFEAVQVPQGRPQVFVSHGVHDGVLPIDECSRRIVPQLEDGGYDVTYTEFDGGHRVPWAVAGRAAEWLRGR